VPQSHANRVAFWRDTLADWKRSGLSVTSYCRRHQLSASTFHRWKTLLAASHTPTATFVPVTIVADTQVELTLPNGIVAKLPLDCEPTQLMTFVKAVASC
jgi:hypothetical protein